MNIAIIGASGAVGQELLTILQQRHFPCNNLRLFGSDRSAGKQYLFRGKQLTVEQLTANTSFQNVDIAFASAGASTSRQYADLITRYGTILIDNSSAFRMEDDVPLVVPEINPQDALLALQPNSRHIIANPNCTTIILAVVLQAIEPLSHIRQVHVATYQSASGAGAAAMNELQQQFNQLAKNEQPTIQRFPYQLAYNVIPHIDLFDDSGYTKEELKMFYETRKIMHSDIRVSATCIRVPTLRAHSEAVWAETEQPLSVEQITNAIKHANGCEIVEPYPMPLFRSGTDKVAVGRIRSDLAIPNAFSFFCVGDQIRKGAALNAIQIAEYIAPYIHQQR